MTARLELPYRSLAVAAAALLAAAVPGAFAVLHYQRDRILDGETWRLLTGHLVHAGGTHLLWDVGALVCIGFLLEEALRHRYWIVLGVSAATIGAGLFLLDTGLLAYCGLSGVLNGLWVAGSALAAYQELRRDRNGLAGFYLTCLAVLVAKLTLESATGRMLFTDPARLGAAPVPHAHVLGAVGGLVSLIVVAAVAVARNFRRGSRDRDGPRVTAGRTSSSCTAGRHD